LRRLLPSLVLLTGLSCSDSNAPVPGDNPFGARFRVVGDAAGGDGAGNTADCQLDLVMELDGDGRPVPSAIEFPGIMGGGVSRRVLNAEGGGFAFFADVYWPDAAARFGSRLRVDLVLGDTLSIEGGRFWHEIALLRGIRDGNRASGIWTCAPFDIWQGGYVDTALVVQGTWRTAPY
jgi:hypothetical protein